MICVTSIVKVREHGNRCVRPKLIGSLGVVRTIRPGKIVAQFGQHQRAFRPEDLEKP